MQLIRGDPSSQTNNSESVIFPLSEELSRSSTTVSPSMNSGEVSKNVQENGDADYIRSRLLTRLGIANRFDEERTVPRTDVSGQTLLRDLSRSFHVALKGDNGKSDRLLERRDSIESLLASPGGDSQSMKLSGGNKEGVLFAAAVKVVHIPARSDYSCRMRNALWTPQTELQENAARNTVEFASEDWDVESVLDDEDMVAYKGERIHPAHFA